MLTREGGRYLLRGRFDGGERAIAHVDGSTTAEFDAEGNLHNASLADYLVPSAVEAPSYTLDHTVTPSPTNPLGVKGIGEAGTIGSAAAVMNAVADALSPLGITDIDMPASPNRVWAAIQEARS